MVIDVVSRIMIDIVSNREKIKKESEKLANEIVKYLKERFKDKPEWKNKGEVINAIVLTTAVSLILSSIDITRKQLRLDINETTGLLIAWRNVVRTMIDSMFHEYLTHLEGEHKDIGIV